MNHRPQFVALTETHLAKATSSVNLSRYHLVSRLDRRPGQQGGGVALFAVAGCENAIVHIADSPIDERSWHIFHSDCGPMLLCVWYRRPHQGEIDSIKRFEQELDMHMAGCMAMVCVGDHNVHHKEWLRHSSSTTPEGRELEAVCISHGLRQFV